LAQNPSALPLSSSESQPEKIAAPVARVMVTDRATTDGERGRTG